ncbi:hypothetical protein IAR55_001118 [Kwoniella newhampshirensis]|uniref:RBR-type E3 ubiquitin transferase n=1 Tax=Kwoniella newhampshirensis TaxID=1651941 RepID=A0AAW0Z4S9_9TREE
MADLSTREIVSQCSTLQDDEITVLESIYPSHINFHPNPTNKPGRLLTLTIPIALATQTTVQLDTSSGPSASLDLSRLPPLSLRLVLPATYPLEGPPKPILLRAPLPSGEKAGNWLPWSVLKEVQDKLVDLWTEEKDSCGEGMGVLWKWWDWVGNGDFLSDMGMLKGYTLEFSVPPMLTTSAFHTSLKSYNAGQIHSDFEQTAFSCSICLENRKGKSCVKMPSCGCVFCTPCLNSCWSLAITEGTLESVSCPSVSCVKQRALRDRIGASEDEVEASLVESVVGKELEERWEELKERRKAEIGEYKESRGLADLVDPTYTVCPRPMCQAAVPPLSHPPASKESSASSRVIRLSEISSSSSSPSVSPVTPSVPAEERWERYRVCPKCNYSFCLYCQATWHGPHTPCAFPQTSLIVTEYLSYPEGSEGRRKMEARKGKVNLERMVAKWEEDEANKKWLEGSTRACAGCGVRVEKSHGCNHMTCGRCNAHFCYRCGGAIKPTDPYKHFNTPGTSCYMKLFDPEEVARFERETAAAGGEDFREFRGVWDW